MADPRRLETLRAMLEEDPDDSFTRYALALELRGLGRREQARDELARVLAQDPAYLPTYYHYARLLGDEGQLEQALQVARRGVEAARAAGDGHALSELEELLEELEA